MNDFIRNFIQKFSAGYLTDSTVKAGISQTREISTPNSREITSKKPAADSFACPYCGSAKFVRRGLRAKKHEKVQLYLCKSCRKTFTPQITKGKHYPLAVILDAISIYNLGYSLEETCRIVNRRQQKTASCEAVDCSTGLIPLPHTKNTLSQVKDLVNSDGGKPGNRTLSPRGRTACEADSNTCQTDSPTKNIVTQNGKYFGLKPSTLSTWIAETEPLCRYCQMRPYITQKYTPKDVVIHATLAHRQLYRYLYHRGKCELLINHEYRHHRFNPLREFLEMVPGECPHQYFQEGLRASETPLIFSKTAMIVRGKTNFATRLAEFVLQSVTDRKLRHEALQKFMLANDSVTVATEVPVYIMRDDIEHMKTQLGFEMYKKSAGTAPEGKEISAADGLPRLITGHIDILQIRNGMVHILDYKPKAEKDRPIEQLTLYAMALSRLTGLRLFEFKCAWFDEKDYFEFYPLHVLHKPKGARRRRKVNTKEGTYLVNKDEKKIMNVRPI